MYVPGKLHDVEHVLIDVGTGYYVEKVSGKKPGTWPSEQGKEVWGKI